MFKPRYVLVWCSISMVLLMFVSLSFEQYFVQIVGQQVNNYVSLAADMALINSQTVDDFFTDEMYGSTDANVAVSDINGRSSSSPVLKILAQSNSSDNAYTTYSSIFNWYPETLSIVSTGDDFRDEVFDKLFTSNDDFKDWCENIGYKVTMPAYYSTGTSTFGSEGWVNVPKLSRMGVWNGASTLPAGTEDMTLVNYAIRTNEWTQPKQKGYYGNYYLTPASCGLTYVNRDLVGELFVNNMDLLMRSKFDGNLSEYNGLNVTPFVHENEDNAIDYDIINNGLWSFAKGTSKNVDVEYMLVDVFDDANDPIIEKIYGGATILNSATDEYEPDGVMTAEKLRERGSGLMQANSVGSLEKADSCNIIVAKVTFNADVIVRYRTALFSQWRGKYDNGSLTNFGDLVRNYPSQSKYEGCTDSSDYEYTTYFAVKVM